MILILVATTKVWFGAAILFCIYIVVDKNPWRRLQPDLNGMYVDTMPWLLPKLIVQFV